jgi:hypothetical protein
MLILLVSPFLGVIAAWSGTSKASGTDGCDQHPGRVRAACSRGSRYGESPQCSRYGDPSICSGFPLL